MQLGNVSWKAGQTFRDRAEAAPSVSRFGIASVPLISVGYPNCERSALINFHVMLVGDVPVQVKGLKKSGTDFLGSVDSQNGF